jgi:hypothetical protein
MRFIYEPSAREADEAGDIARGIGITIGATVGITDLLHAEHDRRY